MGFPIPESRGRPSSGIPSGASIPKSRGSAGVGIPDFPGGSVISGFPNPGVEPSQNSQIPGLSHPRIPKSRGSAVIPGLLIPGAAPCPDSQIPGKIWDRPLDSPWNLWILGSSPGLSWALPEDSRGFPAWKRRLLPDGMRDLKLGNEPRDKSGINPPQGNSGMSLPEGSTKELAP